MFPYYLEGGYLKSTQVLQKELEEKEMGVTQKEMGVTQDNTKHTKMQETDRMQTDHMMDQESFHFSDAGDGGSDA